MSKKLLISISVLLFAMCSCESSGAIAEPNDSGDVYEVCVTVQPMDCEDGHSRLSTSADVKFSWELNDTIGIFPSQGGQVEFPITEESVGKSNAEFTGGGWALKAGYSYSAYYPFNFYNRKSTQVPVSYIGQVQNGKSVDAQAHLSDYVCMASGPTVVENGVLRFALAHVGAVLKLNLTLPEATTYSSLVVYTDAKVLPVKKTINLQNPEVSETVTELSDRMTLNLKNVTTQTKNEVVTFWIAFPSVAQSAHKLKVVVFDKYGYAYSANILRADESDAIASFTKNKWKTHHASPVLTEGFNFGIDGWGSDGKDYGGSAE